MKYHIVKLDENTTLCGVLVQWNHLHLYTKPPTGLCKRCVKTMKAQESILALQEPGNG